MLLLANAHCYERVGGAENIVPKAIADLAP